MKVFIVTLFVFVASAAAQSTKPAPQSTKPAPNGTRSPKENNRGGPPPNIPGCANPPKGTKLSDCCTNFPKFFSKEVMNSNCSHTCAKEKTVNHMCCVSDCSLNTFNVLANGKFNAANAKSAIAKMAAKNTKFTPELIGKIVDQCITAGPTKLQDWRSKAPKDMTPNCTSDSSLNIVISGCIRRELFFQCPGMKTTDNCKALVDFGKGCAFFPFHDGPIGGRRPDGEDGIPEFNPSGTPPAGNKTSGQPPAGQPPAGNKPSGQPPAGQPPAGNKPSGQPPAGQPPAGQPPAGNKPTGQHPAENKQNPTKPTGKPNVSQSTLPKKIVGVSTTKKV